MKDDSINPPSNQSFKKNVTIEDQIIDALNKIADSKKKLKGFDEEQADIFRTLQKCQETKDSLFEKLQEFPSDDENKAEIDRLKSKLYDLERSECALSDEIYVFNRYSAGEKSQIRNAIESLNRIPLFCEIKSHLQEFPDYQCRKCVRELLDDWFS